MQSNQAKIIYAAGVEMPVTNVIFHDDFIIAYTDTISVRFEKKEDTLVNGDFKITGDLSVFMPEPVAETKTEEAAPEAATPVAEDEVAIEDEKPDVVVDASAGTVTGVDTAVEGGDTITTDTVETPAAPVTTE